jgi:myb proto-oncogene protein
MMNYYIESPMMPDNNATFVFDDEPFLAYWDSFVLFESVGCGGDW